MKEFKQNKDTGILEVWEDGKKVGEIITMGDIINGTVPKTEEAKGRLKNEERAIK